jgi:nucleoside-diphosphate-sugar epimerase
MIAYVTGIAGFLGSNVAKQLMGHGWTVLGCDNMLTGNVENIQFGSVFFLDDIRTLGSMPTSVDLVVHTAAIARSAWPDGDEVMDVNYVGTQNVLEKANNAGAAIVVCSSSMSAFPDANAYAYSKYLSEVDALAAGAVALRYSNIYGRGQSEDGPEPNVFAAWRKQRHIGAIRVDGDGSQTRDFIHVDDAARATVSAGFVQKTTSKLGGQWFDVCTGVQTSIAELALEFSSLIRYAPRRDGDPDEIIQDPAPAEREFGFVSSVHLKSGLKEVLE